MNRRKFITAVAGTGVVGLAGCLNGGDSDTDGEKEKKRKKPEKVAKLYMKTLNEGNIEEMITYVHKDSEEYKELQNMSEEETKQFKEFVDMVEIKVTESELQTEEDGKAEVKLTTESVALDGEEENAEKQTGVLVLKTDKNGKWKVYEGNNL